MRLLKPVSLLVVAIFVATLFGSVSSQSTLSVSIHSSFSNRHACVEEWVSFEARPSEAGATITWYLNGGKDPHGFGNSTKYSFQIGGQGTYKIAVEAHSRQGIASSSLEFTTVICESGTATAQPQPTGSAYAHIWVQEICLEGSRISGQYSQGVNGAAIAAYAWTVTSPDGAVRSFEGREFTLVGGVEGYYRIVLRVKDANGNVGEAVRSDYYFVFCKGQSTPTATVTCEKYEVYNPETRQNETRERCATSTGSPPTAQPGTTAPDASKCRDLQARAQSFKSDWSYRYEKASAEGDRSTMQSLEQERAAFQERWQSEWAAARCDYSAGGSDECSQAFANASSEIAAMKERLRTAWDAYWRELEQARQEFAAKGYHNGTEKEAFEARWRARADEIESRTRSEVQALLQRHPRLQSCGFYYDGGRPVDDYATKYGAAPQAVPAYVQERDACEDRMIQIREEYADRFASLYKRLYSVPSDSTDYALIKGEIQALEEEVQKRAQSILSECRAAYKQDYQQPDNYRESAGNLACYFDSSAHRVVCKGKYVGFQGNPSTQSLSRYSCGGELYFDEMYSNTALEDFRLDSDANGGVLRIRSSNLKVNLHDSPRGVINVGVVGGAEMYFVPAVHLRVFADAGKIRVQGAESAGVWLGSSEALVWDEAKRVIIIRGEATWVAESCMPDGSRPDGDNDGRYRDAIEKRRLGAQVLISLRGDSSVDQDNETYDDNLHVRVKRHAEKRYEAIIDSQVADCKTVVLKFDGSIFASIQLKVELTDEQGNTLPIQEAQNLEDVLEPCDDGENGFEYWIVADRLGTQVLVSFAHFSEKRLTVEAASVGNVVVPGFGAELAIVAVAGVVAVAVALRRRITP